MRENGSEGRRRKAGAVFWHGYRQDAQGPVMGGMSPIPTFKWNEGIDV